MKNAFVAAGVLSVLFSGFSKVAGDNESGRPETPKELAAAIGSLAAEKQVWREITWNRCLLEGLAESRKRNKPVLLWVFLHHPNEERC